MIRRAVFSYFNSDNFYINSCGFAKYSDFLYTTSFAVEMASRHFEEVVMVSSSWGIELFKKIGLPVTEYSNSIDKMKSVSRYFWAYGKLLAYAEQKTPFVHIDNDVILWEPLPERILNAELCFQSEEPFFLEGYKYYMMLKIPFKEAPVKPQDIVDNEVNDYAYNCGICGGHRLKFFREWIKVSQQYIFAPENQELFFVKYRDMLIHQNLFHEQYFAACLIKKYDLREKVEVLHPDATKINTVLKYSHLWGNAKRDQKIMRSIRRMLREENPELYNRITSYCVKNNVDKAHIV